MKKFSLLAITLFFCLASSFAQKNESITINEGQQLSSIVYLYDDFSKGDVIFKSGARATPLLNYNMLTKLIQFKDERGITMDIDNPDDIVSINLNGSTYIYGKNGYIQYVNLYGDVILAKQTYLLLRDILAKSGYGGQLGTTSAASSISNVEQSMDYTLPAGESRVYEKTDSFFIVKNGRVLPLNQKNLIKSFPKQKSVIQQYINEKKTDMDNEEQVKEMLSYITSN